MPKTGAGCSNVERLKKQMLELSEQYNRKGKRFAEYFIEGATYEELFYVANVYCTHRAGCENNLGRTDMFTDELIGDYLLEECKDDSNLIYVNGAPSMMLEEFEQGFKDAVDEYWDQIAPSLLSSNV